MRSSMSTRIYSARLSLTLLEVLCDKVYALLDLIHRGSPCRLLAPIPHDSIHDVQAAIIRSFVSGRAARPSHV